MTGSTGHNPGAVAPSVELYRSLIRSPRFDECSHSIYHTYARTKCPRCRILPSTVYINSEGPFHPTGSFPLHPISASPLPPSPFHSVHPSGPLTDYRPEAGLCYRRQLQMGRYFEENTDPLARVIAPPADESPDQRRIRERSEADAKRTSEQIDEALKAEREERKSKRKNRLNVLLLGQSESGT